MKSEPTDPSAPRPPIIASRIARDWEFIDGGVDCNFPGCAAERYDDVATGRGRTAREALHDALDQLASNGWDLAACEQDIPSLSSGLWDRDLVSEALAQHVVPATLRVRFYGSCGRDTGEGGNFYNVGDALESVREILDGRRALAGFKVDDFAPTLKLGGHDVSPDVDALYRAVSAALESRDDGKEWKWEAREPDDCGMMPDSVGTLYLEIVRGSTLEENEEDSDLSYFFSVRVSEVRDRDALLNY